MVYALLLACVMAAPDEAGTVDSNLHAYKEARAVAGRDADAHVRLALWCEARGLIAERTKHLTIATLIDPNHAAARGLLGMVRYRGQWLSPDAVAAKIQADPEQQARIREYLQRRPRAADKADDQFKLALWCERNGLEDQAVAHFHRAVQLDPGREVAWKHLGYRKEKGRWVKPEQLAAEREMAEIQTKADKHWKPILEKLRSELSSKKAEDREKAQAALDAIGDPAAVPMIWATFARGDARRQEVAVELFGRIDSPYASKALAMLAVDGRSAEVKRRSVEHLKRRDPRDFVEVLVLLIRKPIEYEVRHTAGVDTPGELFVKGTDKNFRRLYTPSGIPNFVPQPNDTYSYDANGLPVVTRLIDRYSALFGMRIPFGSSSGQLSPTEASTALALVGIRPSPNLLPSLGFTAKGAAALSSELIHAGLPAQNVNSAIRNIMNTNNNLTYTAENVDMGRVYGTIEDRMEIPLGQMILDSQMSAQLADQKLKNDVQQIESYNAPIRDLNRKARQVLADTTGADLGDDPEAWDRWTRDLFGRLSPVAQSTTQPTPTVTEDVPLEYHQPAIPVVVSEVIAVRFVRMASCFAAGTPVRTIDGLRPIETIREGDLVLTQDTTTGGMVFNPVVNIFHNPPKETLKIAVEGSDEAIFPTGIHRFWKVGRGWAMARDLEPGDVLRAAGGTVTVRSVETAKTQPVFNLRVANAADFFVGDLGLLAHDNSFATPVEKPFDQVGPKGLATVSHK